MISLGTDVWFRSEQTIEKLKDDLISKLHDQDQKDAVTTSFEKMKGIARSLMDDIDYTKRENTATFKDYMEDMKNVLKILYGCVPLLPDAPPNPPDDIDFLKRNFYFTLERQSGKYITQVYVPITQLVREAKCTELTTAIHQAGYPNFESFRERPTPTVEAKLLNECLKNFGRIQFKNIYESPLPELLDFTKIL